MTANGSLAYNLAVIYVMKFRLRLCAAGGGLVKEADMADIIFFDNYNSKNLEFSNWFACEFRADGRVFKSIEQYMMYEKALTFGDTEIAARVLDVTDPAEIKALGRQVKNYDDAHWNGRRQLVVYKGLLAKFSQNEALKQKLFATGSALLAECEPTDKIWGIGMGPDDDRRFDRSQWQGQNLLGYTLSEIREDLKKL